MKVENPEDQNDFIYTGQASILKLCFVGFSLFFFFLFLILPSGEIASSQARKILSKNKNCPLKFEKISLPVFPPSIELENAFLPPKCFGKRQGGLSLKKLSLKIGLPSLDPIGLGIGFNAKTLRSSFRGKIVPGFGKTNIQLHPKTSLIQLEEISKTLDLPTELQGKIQPDLNVNINKGSLSAGIIKMRSPDFKIDKTDLSGLNIPFLDMGNLTFVSEVKNNTIDIKKLTIGSKTSPFEIKLSGKLKKALPSITKSDANLLGDLRIGEEFKQNFSVLVDQFTGSLPKQGDYHKFSYRGPLSKFKPRAP